MLQKQYSAFLWNDKRPKINMHALCSDQINGGLGFILIREFYTALVLSWLPLLISDTVSPWKSLVDSILSPVGGIKFLLCCNYKLNCLQVEVPIPEYLKLLLNKFKMISHCTNFNFLSEIIWNNQNITRYKKSFYDQTLIRRGILVVADLLNNNRSFKTWAQIKENFSLNESS